MRTLRSGDAGGTRGTNQVAASPMRATVEKTRGATKWWRGRRAGPHAVPLMMAMKPVSSRMPFPQESRFSGRISGRAPNFAGE